MSSYPTDELFGGLSNLSLLSKFHVYSVFVTVHLSSHLALSTHWHWEAAQLVKSLGHWNPMPRYFVLCAQSAIYSVAGYACT